MRRVGVAVLLSKRKEEVLEKAKNEDLLMLAKSILDVSTESDAGRPELMRIIKNSLSIEDIEKRLQELKAQKTSAVGKETDLRYLFRGQAGLKASVIVIFMSFIMVVVFGAVSNAIYSYINSITIDYDLRSRLIAELNLAGLVVNAVGTSIRIIGLALLTYWLFSSAIRVGSASHVTGGILALAAALVLAGYLISTVSVQFYAYYY